MNTFFKFGDEPTFLGQVSSGKCQIFSVGYHPMFNRTHKDSSTYIKNIDDISYKELLELTNEDLSSLDVIAKDEFLLLMKNAFAKIN